MKVQIVHVLFAAGFSLAVPFSGTTSSLHQRDGLGKRYWPIQKGYVAFGDSYGAGMGTGTTTTDGCRVGSNSYPDLLNKWTNNPSVEYQRFVCSGDTTVGLDRQINEWKNPSNADLATVSVGGNNVGFSNLVYYCVITPWPGTLGSYNRRKCLETQAAARQLLDDTSDRGLIANLTATYKKILDKSGRDDFHVYVTSYVDFFNQYDTDCDKTTFHYEWAQYDPPSDRPLNRIVYLTTDLRAELNDLVRRLNQAIRVAIEAANRQHGAEHVHFVDLQPAWERGQHHWCEAGNFHEPEPNRQDTWFFLSGWPDVPIERETGTTDRAQDEADLKQILGGIKLPDPGSCVDNLGSDPDPYAQFMCLTSQSMSLEPKGGPIGQSFDKVNKELAAIALSVAAAPAGQFDFSDTLASIEAGIGSDPNNVTANHISYWLPTRQVKTFHPRSPGMVAYRDAVIDAITSAQPGPAQSERGTCQLNIDEIWTCEPDTSNLYAHFTLKNGTTDLIYSTPDSTSAPGVPINDGYPFSAQAGAMPAALKIVAEHAGGDYIQFEYGQTRWTTTAASGDAKCAIRGADWPTGGPSCPGPAVTRNFLCHFPC